MSYNSSYKPDDKSGREHTDLPPPYNTTSDVNSPQQLPSSSSRATSYQSNSATGQSPPGYHESIEAQQHPVYPSYHSGQSQAAPASSNQPYGRNIPILGQLYGAFSSPSQQQHPNESANQYSRQPNAPANNFTQQASTNAQSAMKNAASLIESFVNSRIERRQEKNNRRAGRKEARRDRRRGLGIRGELSSDSGSLSDDSGYGKGKGRARGDHNPQDLIVKQATSLTYDHSWSGRECELETTQGNLTVHGSLTASESIILKNTNGNIKVDGLLISKDTICIGGSNGAFCVDGAVMTNDLIVETTNGPIIFRNQVETRNIILKGKNGPIELNTIIVGSIMDIRSSNASVTAHIQGIKDGSAKLTIETANAPVSVYLPPMFSGYFSLESPNHPVQVFTKSPETMLQFEINERDRKRGVCRAFGNQSNIQIHIKTSNAPVNLYI